MNPSKQVWESYTDEVSGHEYYHNPLTGENTWAIPGDATIVPGVREDTTEVVKVAGHTRQSWGRELCYDKDGTPYYYNFQTEESAWELPSGNSSRQKRAKKQKGTTNASSASDSEYSSESDSYYDDLEGGDVMEKLNFCFGAEDKATSIVKSPPSKRHGRKGLKFSKEKGSWVAC